MPRMLAVSVLGLLVYGCVKADIDESRDEMRQHLAACTQRYGFDPARSESIDERELAPGERDWRDCAYSGVERIVLPKARSRDGWLRLMSADRAMTNQVDAGTLTRTERRIRLQAMLDDLVATERSLQSEEDAERLRQSQAFSNQFGPITMSGSQRVTDAQISAVRAGMLR